MASRQINGELAPPAGDSSGGDAHEEGAWPMTPGQGDDVGAFIPTRGGKFGPARDPCRQSAVSEECFDFAVAHGELVGMCGGTTERARRVKQAGRGVA
jgi:hypothetical protein